LRTEHGHSPMVSSGNVLFTLLGFLGMYTILSLLYIFLMLRRIDHGAAELRSQEQLTFESAGNGTVI
jgi:cytochrome d ubiquinol oxidase subunit I